MKPTGVGVIWCCLCGLRCLGAAQPQTPGFLRLLRQFSAPCGPLDGLSQHADGGLSEWTTSYAC